MNAFVVDVGRDDFQQMVVEGSRTRPVLVDFWASWCGPCRALGPVLEKLAAEYDGRFLLAKVDSDREQELAARFGVRGIPNVKAFVDGRVVDEFSGALPESAVREFLEPLLPSLAAPLVEQALARRASGNLPAALALLDEALVRDQRHEPAHLARAEVLIELGRNDEAAAVLDAVEDRARDGRTVARLRARLALGGGGDVTALASRVAHDPADLPSRLDLAHALAAAGDHDRALGEALEIVRRDRSFGDDAGRKVMLRIFDLLGADSDLVRRYRRELASVINR